MPGKCYFCKQPAESQARGFACCRRCAKEVLLPLVRDALGADGLLREAQAMRPMPSGLPGDRGGTQMSRGTGRPARQPQRPRRPLPAGAKEPGVLASRPTRALARVS
jgi:hypothetical protein